MQKLIGALAGVMLAACASTPSSPPAAPEPGTAAQDQSPEDNVPPDAVDWRKCSGSRDRHTDSLKCSDLQIRVFTSARTDTRKMMDEYFAMNVEPLRDSHDVKVERDNIDLEASLAYWYTIAPKAVGMGAGEGYLVAIAPFEGGSRMVTCTSAKRHLLRTRCRPFMKQAVAQGVPDEIVGAAALPKWAEGTFVGRRLPVPGHCTRAPAKSQHIECQPTGMLSWKHAEQVQVALEQVMDERREAIRKIPSAVGGAAIQEKDYACRVEEVDAKCQEFLMPMAGEKELVFIQTVATVRGQDVYVLCSWEGPRASHVPTPCDAVLTIESEAR